MSPENARVWRKTGRRHCAASPPAPGHAQS